MQHLPMQALADQRAHKVARLVAGFTAAVIVRRKIEQRATAHQELAFARALSGQRPAVRLVDIVALGVDGAARGIAVEQRSITELGEQAFFEAAQDPGKIILQR